MACRPLYQPQFAHTVCGLRIDEQRGHTERGDGSKVHALARRLRVLDFDILRLGTAIGASLFERCAAFSTPPGTE